MFDNLSNNDISNAVDELVTCLGVKDQTPYQDLLALLRKKDTQGCVQEIASRLGLPIQISLSYVPKDFKGGDTNRFHTEQLARTDWTGRGIGGITAQVAIPEHLPMYGSKALEGYLIRVRVSENCQEYPATFIAVMAHELSHVLLRSLIHPQKDSELHTDLVPILLGFRDIVERGRKTVESTARGNVTTTRKTTYGYLTDSQFRFAYDKVGTMLEGHKRDKERLLEQVAQVRRKLQGGTRRLAKFRNYLQYIDKHPRKNMRGEHGSKLVECHGLDYTRGWEIAITQGKSTLEGAEAFVRPVRHYTSRTVEQLSEYARRVSETSGQFDDLVGAITADLRILRGYVGLICRFWSIVWLRSQPGAGHATN